MKPPTRDQIVIAALRENPSRQVYEGADGLWHITYQGPDLYLRRHEVQQMEAAGILELEFEGFYRLAPKHLK